MNLTAKSRLLNPLDRLSWNSDENKTFCNRTFCRFFAGTSKGQPLPRRDWIHSSNSGISVKNNDTRDKFVDSDPTLSKTLAEVVLAVVHPKRTSYSLVSFLLPFGKYETDLQLFATSNLRKSYTFAGLIAEKHQYNNQDVLKIMRNYY